MSLLDKINTTIAIIGLIGFAGACSTEHDPNAENAFVVCVLVFAAALVYGFCALMWAIWT